MRQKTLREFTENARKERTQDSPVLSVSSKDRIHQGLDDFVRQFKERHPERANKLSIDLRPEHEKRAVTLVNEYKRLEKMLDEGDRPKNLVRDDLGKLAQKMSKQKDVMKYVHEKHIDIEKQVNQLVRTLEKGRGFER